MNTEEAVASLSSMTQVKLRGGFYLVILYFCDDSIDVSLHSIKGDIMLLPNNWTYT